MHREEFWPFDLLADFKSASSGAASECVHAIIAAREEMSNSGQLHCPIAWRHHCRGLSICGLDAPKEVGGSSVSFCDMGRLFALCGYISLDLRDVPGVGHARMLLHSTNVSAKELLRSVVQADDFFAVAITEPSAGSDMSAIRTTARPVKDGYLLQGVKRNVARLRQATWAVVFGRVSRGTGPQGLTCFAVPLGAEGVEIRDVPINALTGVSFGEAVLNDVFVPGRYRIGAEGQGFAIFRRHFTYWRVAMACAAIGCAYGALEQAVQRLRTRHAFGGPIGRFTHFQQQLAENYASLRCQWVLAKEALGAFQAGIFREVDGAMVKVEALESASRAVDWSIRVFGAEGLTATFDLEKRHRDLLALRVADGTCEVLRSQVARALLGESLYRMGLHCEQPAAARLPA